MRSFGLAEGSASVFRFESGRIENETRKDPKMNRKNLFVFPILLLLLTVSLFGNYEEGKKIFAAECSSCHRGYIPEQRLKENFFKAKNRLLNLKAPTVNMLVYGIMRGPKKIGDPEDPEMRQIEIEEYLRDYLEHPDERQTLLSPAINRYFETTHPRVKLDDEALANLAQYFMHYSEDHHGKPKPLKRHFEGTLDLQTLLAEAKQSGKTLIVEASSPTCHYCKKMDREVLSDPEIQRMLRKNFIFAEVNIRRSKLPPKLVKAYQHITPSFFFLSPEGKLLHSYPGSWTKTDFVSILRENLPKVRRD